MIPTVLDSHLKFQIKKLGGIINEDTVKKHLTRNIKSARRKIFIEPRLFFFMFLTFCGSILAYHCYSLWKKHINNPPTEGCRSITELF